MRGATIVGSEIRDLQTGAEQRLPVALSWIDWATDGETILATEFTAGSYPVGRIVHCVIDQPDSKVELSARNLQNVKVLRAEGVNVYDVLNGVKN